MEDFVDCEAQSFHANQPKSLRRSHIHELSFGNRGVPLANKCPKLMDYSKRELRNPACGDDQSFER